MSSFLYTHKRWSDLTSKLIDTFKLIILHSFIIGELHILLSKSTMVKRGHDVGHVSFKRYFDVLILFLNITDWMIDDS